MRLAIGIFVAVSLSIPQASFASDLWVDREFRRPAPEGGPAQLDRARYAHTADGQIHALVSTTSGSTHLLTLSPNGNLLREKRLASLMILSSLKFVPLPSRGRIYIDEQNTTHIFDSDTSAYVSSFNLAGQSVRELLPDGKTVRLTHTTINLSDQDGSQIFDRNLEVPTGAVGFTYFRADAESFVVRRNRQGARPIVICSEFSTGNTLWMRPDTSETQFVDVMGDGFGKYVVLEVESSGSGRFIRRLDRAGNTLWVRGPYSGYSAQFYDPSRNRNVQMEMFGANIVQYQGDFESPTEKFGVLLRSVLTGDVVATWESPDYAYGEPKISREGVVFYPSSSDRRQITGRRLSDGVLVYHHTFDSPRTTELCDHPGGPITVSRPELGKLEALDIKNGGIKWQALLSVNKPIINAGNGGVSGNQIVALGGAEMDHYLLDQNLEVLSHSGQPGRVVDLGKLDGNTFSYVAFDEQSQSYFFREASDNGIYLCRYSLLTGARVWATPIIGVNPIEQARVANGKIELTTPFGYSSIDVSTGALIQSTTFLPSYYFATSLASRDLAHGFIGSVYHRLGLDGNPVFTGPIQQLNGTPRFSRELPNGKVIAIGQSFLWLYNPATGIAETSYLGGTFVSALFVVDKLFIAVTGPLTVEIHCYDPNTLQRRFVAPTGLPWYNYSVHYALLSRVVGSNEIALSSNLLPGTTRRIFSANGERLHDIYGGLYEQPCFVGKLQTGAYIVGSNSVRPFADQGTLHVARFVPSTEVPMQSWSVVAGESLNYYEKALGTLDRGFGVARERDRPTIESIHKAFPTSQRPIHVRTYAMASSSSAIILLQVLNVNTGHYDTVARKMQGDFVQTLTAGPLNRSEYVNPQTQEVKCRVAASYQNDADDRLPLVLSVDNVKVAELH